MKIKTHIDLKNTFRALKYRNYRLFFIGQGISLIGTWMQRIALSWLVYRLTNSPFLLGVVNFSSDIPTFILTPFAGVYVDKYNRYKIIILTQIIAMVQALVLGVLVLTGSITVLHTIIFGMILGIVNAFDMPARQAFVVHMVDKKEDLGNAIALNSSIFNIARIIGPSIGGVLISLFGEGLCFIFNGVSYIAVIVALLMMKITNINSSIKKELNVFKELKEGYNYALGYKPIKATLLFIATLSVVGLPYIVLMPVFARDVLSGGPRALGMLMGSAGIGALVGAFYLASRNSLKGLAKIIPISTVIFGLALIFFSISRNLHLSMFIIFFTGMGMIMQTASSNTLIQSIVDDDKRGRVMSFYAMAFRGMLPFGSLFAGTLASLIGAPFTVLIAGIISIVVAFLFSYNLPSMKILLYPENNGSIEGQRRK